MRSRTIWHISKGEQVRNVILIRLGLWNKVKVIVYRCLTPFWTIFHLYCSGNKCYRRKSLIWRKLRVTDKLCQVHLSTGGKQRKNSICMCFLLLITQKKPSLLQYSRFVIALVRKGTIQQICYSPCEEGYNPADLL